MFMRMSCNSTYLLDKETDYGHKCDEAAQLLEEVFESPEAKVVVFSQWLGTHELLMRRFDPRGWQSVFFNGSVSSEGRKKLVDRFRDDPACRLFLSTDAGGVGLNLQHAANVINMDLPWNPAVLEQRIGRVHRMGQSRGVQVVNFVGQGSIEEGILSVLAFKKSLFAGVLDGGESEVFLQGTKLSQFMKSVEQVAGAMGEADADPEEASPSAPSSAGTPAAPGDPAPTQGDAMPIEEPQVGPTPATTAGAASNGTEAADPWAAMLEAGAALLQGLATARSASATAPGAAPFAIERDPVTGQASVRLPLPEPAVLQKLAKALEPWLRH
jgi:hypothetical protein